MWHRDIVYLLPKQVTSIKQFKPYNTFLYSPFYIILSAIPQLTDFRLAVPDYVPEDMTKSTNNPVEKHEDVTCHYHRYHHCGTMGK